MKIDDEIVILPSQRRALHLEQHQVELPPERGYSRADCTDCGALRSTLVASCDTPDEGPAFVAWTRHMNQVHPGWRSQPNPVK